MAFTDIVTIAAATYVSSAASHKILNHLSYTSSYSVYPHLTLPNLIQPHITYSIPNKKLVPHNLIPPLHTNTNYDRYWPFSPSGVTFSICKVSAVTRALYCTNFSWQWCILPYVVWHVPGSPPGSPLHSPPPCGSRFSAALLPSGHVLLLLFFWHTPRLLRHSGFQRFTASPGHNKLRR